LLLHITLAFDKVFQTPLFKGLKMSLTNTELQTVFNRSKLPQLGYTFQKALACDAIKTCLVRIATNMQNKPATAPIRISKAQQRPAKTYWFNNI